jgi:hypothetical protein
MLLLGVAACPLSAAAEPRSLALPEFELMDDMREFASPEMRREDDRRILLASGELAKEFDRRGLYRINLPTKPEAERVARCWVQKVSNLILNINIEVSTAQDEVLYTSSVDIRGNTDESWLRGVRRLVDNIEARNLHLR